MCQWCLMPLQRHKATADHIIPSSRGGSDYWNNLLISCYDCNHNRQNKSVISKRGVWLDNNIPKPHGPQWDGPFKNINIPKIAYYWCKCHKVKERNNLHMAKRPKSKQKFKKPPELINEILISDSYGLPALKNWGDLKKMIESAGIKDDDIIFMVDIGPEVHKLFISKIVNIDGRNLVEISDSEVNISGD